MPTKPKTPQKESPEELQTRDFFQTPAYAVDLLIPFIPKHVKYVWEPCAGGGNIVKRLQHHGYKTEGTDIQGIYPKMNFLLDWNSNISEYYEIDSAIITNPPFSLKQKVYNRCREYGVPFALLVPLDYSQWVCNSLWKDGAEKIIPTSRINYITPSGKQGKESSSQFHSGWLCWGFGLGKTETFVELSKKDKENI